MKKFTRTLAIAQASITMLSLVLLSMPTSAFAATAKVDICHNGHILSVSANGLNGHTQDRHPSDFLITSENRARCTTETETVTPGTLHVTKVIVGNPNAHPQDFSFQVDQGSTVPFSSTGTNDISKLPGTYSVQESVVANYTTTYASTDPDHLTDCSAIDITEEGDATCTITNTYHAPETPPSCNLVSDTTTMVGTSPAALSFVHSAWTHGLDLSGAKWIWNAFHATPGASDEVVTFTKKFNVVGTPTSVKLDLAADNTYSVSVNGTPSCSDTVNLDNFSSVEPTCNITSLVTTGVNTLTFTVTNKGGFGTDPEQNPGGLIYKVTVDGASCAALPPPATTVKVHLYKYLKEGSTINQIPDSAVGVPQFPMFATYSTTNIGSGTNAPYVLGNGHGGAAFKWAADTSSMSVPANYESHENTDGTVVVANSDSCSPGKYFLVGYKNGDSLAAAQGASVTATAPSYTGLTSDKYEIVVNQKCADAPAQRKETIVVSGNTAPGVNQAGWLFNRDTTTATPFAFNTTSPDIGTGSLQVFPITNTGNGTNDKFVGELFLLKAISALSSLTYDFKISGPNVGAANQFYLNVYANFGESLPTKFYDCRYDVVPTIGSVAGFTTVTFDPTQSYPVTQRGDSLHTCPASPSGMQALSASGTATIRAIALNVGDRTASDQGVGGFFDKVVVTSPTLMTTYDFEPAPVRPVDMCSNIEGNQATVPEGMTASNGVCTATPTVTTTSTTSSNNGGGRTGGRSSGGSSGGGGGSVLGASTTGSVLGESCGLYMDKNLRIKSKKNDPEQTKKIQTFLNKHLSAGLPVTGYFGKLSEKALKSFQQQYAGDILTPWGIKAPTGIAYHTTLKKINEIECPELTLELPPLVEWSKNPNAQ